VIDTERNPSLPRGPAAAHRLHRRRACPCGVARTLPIWGNRRAAWIGRQEAGL